MIAFQKNNAMTGELVLILFTGRSPWSLNKRKRAAA
jgi:hypothetical protein